MIVAILILCLGISIIIEWMKEKLLWNKLMDKLCQKLI